eukprot:c14807_g1_i1 orf=346-1605(-)
MANSFSELEGEIQRIQTEAEITLKKLLDKQLATTGRLEQVDFQEATENMRCIGHGSSGVSSRKQFVENELLQKQLDEKAHSLCSTLQLPAFSKAKMKEHCRRISYSEDSALPDSGKVESKRQRYGAHPTFMVQAESDNCDITTLQRKFTKGNMQTVDSGQLSFGRHAKEIEASLLRGKDRLQTIAHLSAGGTGCRKPLQSNLELSGICMGVTPQDRARCTAEQEHTRSADDVFANRVPEVLYLHSYLDQRQKAIPTTIDRAENYETSEMHNPNAMGTGGIPTDPDINHPRSECSTLPKEISEIEILSNRLLEDEIRDLPCGKFANYSPGEPSHILYVKNLSPEVTEADLAALFLRYQDSGQRLLFRLMQRGRMKGQAFITFPDKETAQHALQLINGYRIKGRPMVIEFGHASAKHTHDM